MYLSGEPRPNSITKEQRYEIFKELAKQVMSYGLVNRNADLEEIINDLSTLRISDGYDMTKELENSYSLQNDYDCDSMMVDALDGASSHLCELKRKNVKQWVLDTKPKRIFNKGFSFPVNRDLGHHFKDGGEYYVTGFNEDQAYYTIDKNPERKGGVCIDYERLESFISLNNGNIQ